MRSLARRFATPVVLLLTAHAPAARAAPEWIGVEQERTGTPVATCTGPAVKVAVAYQGEADGSSPAVGDVYPVRFTFQNLGNCTGDLGETVYGFDVAFSLPGRHQPMHNTVYGDSFHQIKCVLRDAAGGKTEVTFGTCALRVDRSPAGRWVIDTAGGVESYRWKVPRGQTLEVTVPVAALDPVAKSDAGLEVNVQLQLNPLAGRDSTDLRVPMAVAASPLLIDNTAMMDLGPTAVTLSARMFNRFSAGESYIQLEPAPLFDSVRLFGAPDGANYEDNQTTWLDLTPDTEYRWRAGILTKGGTLVGEFQTFRTPPASQALVVHRSGAGPVCLLMLLLLGGLARSRRSSGSWAGALLITAASLMLPACSGGGDPGAGGPADGGRADAGSSGGAEALRIEFLRALPGLFTIPAGWEVKRTSLEAWQRDPQHVITLSPPGNPSVVLGLRALLTTISPARVIEVAALSAQVVSVIENRTGAGDGSYARWIAQVTLEGKPAVMGMFAWATPPNVDGERFVALAALVAPTRTEFDRLGGIGTLRQLAYGQTTYREGSPELMLSGKYEGVEGTGRFFDPTTDVSSDSSFGLTVTLSGDRITASHFVKLSSGAGTPAMPIAFTSAEGTYLRADGMIIPSWTSCATQTFLNRTVQQTGPCAPGWGAALEFIPRGDGSSFLVRMPGLASPSVDEQGTVLMRAGS
jgi:hypothetical protein